MPSGRRFVLPVVFALCSFFLSVPYGKAQAPCVPNGDVNGDERVTPDDSRLAFQHFLGTATPPLSECAQTRANVFNPGGSGITPADVVCILDHFLGLPSCILDGPPIQITSFAPGALISQGHPVIELTYGSIPNVDPATLTFSINGTALAVTCQTSATGARCTPDAPLPEGVGTLEVSIMDSSGAIYTSAVAVTVDTAPVAVTLTTPEDGLITRAATIEVTGTVGPGVTAVAVNGVEAVVTAEGFRATVPLREGTNMLVAVARRDSGRTGTDAVDVTRDILAPTVRIDAPRDGSVTANSFITITGLVNDIVNGATEAQVTVNGVQAAIRNGAFMVTGLPLRRGPNTLEAVATDAVGNTGRHTITVMLQTPVGPRLTLVSGDGQRAMIGQTLPDPLVLRVTDDQGNPLAGRMARFAVTRNNGLLQGNATGTPARTVQVMTDAEGQAAVRFTLGATAGEGNQRVTATVLGVAGTVEFCASGLAAPPGSLLLSMGDNRRGAIGSPLAIPLEAQVVDAEGNPLEDVAVTFTVLQGEGNLHGEPSLTRTTGMDGKARAVLTLGPLQGINNNVVQATTDTLPDQSVTFLSSGLAPGNPAATRFSGVVLDNTQTPIPGAVVTIPDTEIQGVTDTQGQFLLENVPVGHIHLHIDPAESPRPETFPPLAFETVTVAGQVNVLGQPILIPALAGSDENTKIVGGDEDVTLRMPGVAGVELTIFANSVTCPDGSRECRVSIDQVHLDKVPMPPPGSVPFLPPAWTVQSAGTAFDPPARITIPNNGLPPGRMVDVFQFDHALNQFVSIGKGTVSEDAAIITSDAGFGITHAGWGGGRAPPPPPMTCGNSCDACMTATAGCNACMADDTNIPEDSPNDCFNPTGCSDGVLSREPDDSEMPMAQTGNCMQEVCQGGMAISMADDSDLPGDACKTCGDGQIINRSDGSPIVSVHRG